MDVWDTPPLDLRIVPVHQDSTGLTGTYFSSLMDDSRDIFPLAELNEDIAPVYTTSVSPFESNNDNGAWSDLLSEINALRVAEGTGQHYYGLVRTSYTSGIAGVGYVGLPASIGWDRTASGGWVAAHEIGHNFGRYHAPCPSSVGSQDNFYPHADAHIGEVGYKGGQLVAPDSHRDLMSYCGPRWISDYNYDAILDYRGTGSMQVAQAQVRGPALVLWGSITPEHGVILEPSFEVETVPELPREAGPYRLEGISADGRVLFGFSFDAHETGEEDGNRGFAFALPMDRFPAAELRVVRILEHGREVARQESRAWSMDAPQAMHPPALTTVRGPRGQTRIEWDSERHPLLVVRDPNSGRILSLARGGAVTLPYAPAGGVEAVVSDGVQSFSEIQRRE